MKFSLAYQNTGDSIEFDAVNSDLVQYYVTQLINQDVNLFCASDPHKGERLKNTIQSLHDLLEEINDWKDLLETSLPTCQDLEYLFPHNLNHIHAAWAKSLNSTFDVDAYRKKYPGSRAEQIHNMYPDHIQQPLFGDVLQKLDLSERYGQVNLMTHEIERHFDEVRYRCQSHSWVCFDNPFSKNLLTDDLCNLSLTFNHLGRTLLDKYNHFDMNLEYQDENSYDQLLGFVSLRLRPAQKKSMGLDYQQWCKSIGKEPIGDNLNLGNIPNLVENISSLNQMIYRNLLHNNAFSFYLH